MPSNELHANLYGWWRIVETSQWVNDGLDDLGPALISITGSGDRLRMHSLLAYVNTKPTKTGASFTWEGAWEYDPMSGTGSVRIGKDGKLHGRIKIKDGDESTFLAERAAESAEPIPPPPSYLDKWRRRRTPQGPRPRLVFDVQPRLPASSSVIQVRS
jgi:hypothetical protein